MVENNPEKQNNNIQEALSFGALYHSADAQWIGGALIGNVIVDKYGINPWLVAGGVATTVATTEYSLSRFAVNIFEYSDDLSRTRNSTLRVGRELLAAAYASFAGSANGVKINDSLGLESTPLRRKVQAGIFGFSVGLWVTPLPLYSDGAELAKDYIDELFEDPANFAIYSIASIGAIYGISSVVKSVRKKLRRRKVNLNHNDTDIS
jgi:hypothetical protein